MVSWGYAGIRGHHGCPWKLISWGYYGIQGYRYPEDTAHIPEDINMRFQTAPAF